MAVPIVAPASIALFQRIPDRLFGPLASQNRHGYWALLCHLHRRRFGPDAPLPPSYGFLQREIIQEIEDHLKYADEWQPESGEQPDTPQNIRAIGIFNRLLDAGWFRLEKYGIEKTVTQGSKINKRWIRRIVRGFEEHVLKLVQIAMATLEANAVEVFQFTEGKDVLSAQMSASEIKEIEINVTLRLKKVKDQQTIERAKTALEVQSQWFATPAVLQEYARPLFAQILETLGYENTDELLPIIPMMPAPAVPGEAPPPAGGEQAMPPGGPAQ